jgi:hypothetical protein
MVRSIQNSHCDNFNVLCWKQRVSISLHTGIRALSNDVPARGSKNSCVKEQVASLWAPVKVQVLLQATAGQLLDVLVGADSRTSKRARHKEESSADLHPSAGSQRNLCICINCPFSFPFGENDECMKLINFQ